jgi:hypothetical protein
LSITGTGTTNFYQSLQESTLGNSILSDSGGILNVSGQEYSLQVLQQMGLNSQNRLLLTGSNPYHLGYLVLLLGYDANTSQGYFNADGSLLLATNG